MKRAFIYIVAVMLYCNPVWADEPDPNLLWKTENFYDRFLVHPNGNILAGKGSTGFELDGNTGEIIREFPYQLIIYDVSPDGKYISALTDQRCVIDYETEEVITRFTNENTFPQFMPDSKTLIYFVIEKIGELKGNLKLQSYNIETKRYSTSTQQISSTTSGAISVSPDGRFVATGGRFFDMDDNEYTRLILWDALTLESIKILSTKENFNSVRSIKFSPDSRLVGFQVYLDNLYIYNTDDYSLYKNYSKNSGKFPTSGFGFITNEYVALGNGYAQPPVFNLVKLNNDQIIFTKNNSSGISDYNEAKNTMIVNYGVIYCYDFEKILTGASIESEIPNPFTVEYINNTINIKNYTFGTNHINCSITDINGRVLRNMNLNPSIGELRIPIKLLSGTYFLHIKDGSKEYVSKFLVVD
ncbi:MAG: T9SS type A sorting domain-containing protein [Candidatus Kapabacteria bacterium]|nr:T9SS type A sorting domain-containing protein [Candidatus Kapabacteria bacterium]